MTKTHRPLSLRTGRVRWDDSLLRSSVLSNIRIRKCQQCSCTVSPSCVGQMTVQCSSRYGLFADSSTPPYPPKCCRTRGLSPKTLTQLPHLLLNQICGRKKRRDVSEQGESNAASGNAVITAGPIITRSGMLHFTIRVTVSIPLHLIGCMSF